MGVPTFYGSSGPDPRQRHQPGLALRGLVVAGAAPSDRCVRARVRGMECFEAETEPVEDAGAEILDQDVRASHQVEQELPILLGLVVERDVYGERVGERA